MKYTKKANASTIATLIGIILILFVVTALVKVIPAIASETNLICSIFGSCTLSPEDDKGQGEEGKTLHPPKNVGAYVREGEGILLKWEKSESEDVQEYEIWRKMIPEPSTQGQYAEPQDTFGRIAIIKSNQKLEYLDTKDLKHRVTYVYYIRSKDSEGDTSIFSESKPIKAFLTPVLQVKIADLNAESREAGRVTLTWTSIGEREGKTPVKYTIKYSEKEIKNIEDSKNALNLPSGNTIPDVKEEGTKQSMEVIGLEAGKKYYFAIVVEYSTGYLSEISNSIPVEVKSKIVEQRVCCKGIPNEFKCEWVEGSMCLTSEPCPKDNINYDYCK